jgi:hypothetical protein
VADRRATSEHGPRRDDRLAGGRVGQAEDRHVEARAAPDLAHLRHVEVQPRVLDDLEAHGAATRAVTEIPEHRADVARSDRLADGSPAVARLALVDAAVLERDEPVDLRDVRDVQADGHDNAPLLLVRQLRDRAPAIGRLGCFGFARGRGAGQAGVIADDPPPVLLAVAHIGPRRARRLIDGLGSDWRALLDEEPERVFATLRGVGPCQARAAATSWRRLVAGSASAHSR